MVFFVRCYVGNQRVMELVFVLFGILGWLVFSGYFILVYRNRSSGNGISQENYHFHYYFSASTPSQENYHFHYHFSTTTSSQEYYHFHYHFPTTTPSQEYYHFHYHFPTTTPSSTWFTRSSIYCALLNKTTSEQGMVFNKSFNSMHVWIICYFFVYNTIIQYYNSCYSSLSGLFESSAIYFLNKLFLNEWISNSILTQKDDPWNIFFAC